MEWTGLNELREKYLSFFESKGHLRLPSFPLVPRDDDTLLLINAGMAPMKKYFLGQVKPPSKRVVTCQKCVRTDDIEHVGKTSRHGTYFEMLGNFSFGDYFKREATAFAWEFVTRVLKMPVDRLWVTIFQDDDEAFDIWTHEVGVDPSRVVRFGREDNFWEHGSLPCGPCSEIYFDRGEQYGGGKQSRGVGYDGDRYVEFWNIVFQQFASDGKGHYTPLKKPNIDTGLGLERLACILQNVDNLFEVDTIRNIMARVGRIAGVTYGGSEKTDESLRVITDHIRSTVFLVSDGVLPSNEGRGYVLRRLVRRAARHGRLLGIKGAFLRDLVGTVVNENKCFYPDLSDKQDYIRRVVEQEEERFDSTIDQGLQLLSADIGRLRKAGVSVLPGDEAFRLYDTFGFPLDLTVEILSEHDMTVERDEFDKNMLRQRETARAARAARTPGSAALADTDTPQTAFRGYDTLSCRAKIEALFTAGERAGSADAGAKVAVILNETPFYAESGGQVGDSGALTTGTAVVRVNDCKKSGSGRFVHYGEVLSGSVQIGDDCEAKVDVTRRAAIRRNHSAAHLLQAALRKVLGEHVHQAGQQVDEHRVRFDFTHFAAPTPDELRRVEAEVNAAVLAAVPVTTRILPISEAKKLGAMALFGEKYGQTVRVVQMGGYSLEFCAGTHVRNTAEIGLFKIVSESSVASGVRRIEGATGTNVLELLDEDQSALRRTAEVFRCAPADLPERALQLSDELRAKTREIEKLNGRIAAAKTAGLVSRARTVGGLHVVTDFVESAGADELRLITDRLRDRDPLSVAVLAGGRGGKLTLVAACGAEAVRKGAHAGRIVKAAAAAAGGGGGGRPDSASAGARDASKAGDALAAVAPAVEKLLSAAL